MLNKVILMGRLATEPELKQTQSGVSVTSFVLAVERDYKDKETGKRDADFINIVAWRQTADFVSKYFAKGSLAVVSGSLQIREYTDKDGNKRKATDVIAENVYFGSSKDSSHGMQNKSETRSVETSDFEDMDDSEGDLPF